MIDWESIPLSYLSQYYFCQRRVALMLLEQVWKDNVYTAEGTAEHKKVHSTRLERHSNMLKIYEMNVQSEELKLSGKCDCVEAEQDEKGVEIEFIDGKYKLYPIEYKHGVIRNEIEYNVQLCAQAMCLEKTYGCKIPEGAIFYIESHRRVSVSLSEDLRKMVVVGAKELMNMLENKTIPSAKYMSKCRKCSLIEYCMPKAKTNSSNYIKKLLNEMKESNI